MTGVSLPNKLQSLINKKGAETNKIDHFVFGQKMGSMTKLFGCWHDGLSRPFVQGKTAYRSCLKCGARKQFNLDTLETYGNFYFPPSVVNERN